MVARCCRQWSAGGTEMVLEQRDERRHDARATLGAPTHQSVKEFNEAFQPRARRRLPRLRAAGPHAQIRKSSELQGDDPLILTLARGHYCPKNQSGAARLSPISVGNCAK